MKDWTEQNIAWERTDDFEFPYAATVDGTELQVRVNEWPDYPFVYTLIADGEEGAEFDEWPEAWTRPEPAGE